MKKVAAAVAAEAEVPLLSQVGGGRCLKETG